MIPFIIDGEKLPFKNGDYIFVKDVKNAIESKKDEFEAFVVTDNNKPFKLKISSLTDDERKIILSGCLINFYKKN